MYKFKFRIPSYFSLVIRSLAVLEGIAIGFDPNYKVLSSSYPWIARKVLTDSSPQLQSTLKNLLYEEGVFRVDRLESLLAESLRAKTEESLVRSRVGNTDSTVATKQVISFTLTEKGAFVREILLQEVAKGLDALGLAILDYIASDSALRLPFAIQLSSVSVADEDLMNLRTLHRLLLLLSRLQKQESPSTNFSSKY
ncbi:putative aarF domain-containing protein kinase [Apostasia shenzhenica]|uniref:Putative aarF domain-containing protein kinase n=1 Tax=Apostasia shenzhenica TaxID=1088818 RepID=A0A2I0BFN4_9ASPA|nr:putative aarF domain-containing protein kinase [Apostasia shenzhenica]